VETLALCVAAIQVHTSARVHRSDSAAFAAAAGKYCFKTLRLVELSPEMLASVA